MPTRPLKVLKLNRNQRRVWRRRVYQLFAWKAITRAMVWVAEACLHHQGGPISLRSLAGASRTSVSTVLRTLNLLETVGMLQRHHRGARRKRTCSVIELFPAFDEFGAGMPTNRQADAGRVLSILIAEKAERVAAVKRFRLAAISAIVVAKRAPTVVQPQVDQHAYMAAYSLQQVQAAANGMGDSQARFEARLRAEKAAKASAKGSTGSRLWVGSRALHPGGV